MCQETCLHPRQVAISLQRRASFVRTELNKFLESGASKHPAAARSSPVTQRARERSSVFEAAVSFASRRSESELGRASELRAFTWYMQSSVYRFVYPGHRGEVGKER